MTFSDFAEIVAMVRDSLLIVLLILALAVMLFTFRKVSNLLNSAIRTVKNRGGSLGRYIEPHRRAGLRRFWCSVWRWEGGSVLPGIQAEKKEQKARRREQWRTMTTALPL